MTMRETVLPILLLTIFLPQLLLAGDGPPLRSPAATPKSDAMLQGFYWNSPPGGIWWDSLAKLAPRLAAGGFSAIWFPSPVKCANGGFSMGYDPYDHYDFGEYNQVGSVETRFGSRQELINSIAAFHQNGISVFADAVMGHMSGGEQYVPYDCDISPTLPSYGWLVFNYPNGSGRFRKGAINFYPNHLSSPPCDWNQANYHGVDPAFKFGEYLALAQPSVRDSLIVWGKYLRNVIGFDGFRLDEAKALDPAFMGPWLQACDSNGFAVAEYFGSGSEIGSWHTQTQSVNGGKVSMFDFPLRYALKQMCNTTSGFYDMMSLDNASLVSNGWSGFDVVTFVENHDFDRVGWDGSIGSGNDPIIYDKQLAYAYIMFSEGRPCVFFKDYFTYGLAGKIDTLNWIRRTYLGGSTTQRNGLNPWYILQDGSQDQNVLKSDIYIARRNGYGGAPGGYLVINDRADSWIDVWVDTELPIGTVYRDYTGHDVDKVVVGPGGGGVKNRIKLWAPPRGYTIYVPDTTQRIRIAPSLNAISPKTAFINAAFSSQLSFNNPGGDTLSFALSGNPGWLSVSSSGLLTGMSDSLIASYTVTVTLSDTRGDTSVSSFVLTTSATPLMDGQFEGAGIWGAPLLVADTLPGYNGAQVKDLYVSSDAQYFYLGAHVKARQTMAWAFLLNARTTGGTTESWGRSIVYGHLNPPDYILRGLFNGNAESNLWIGPYWGGVGSAIAATEYGESIASDSALDGWVEARVLKSALGNPQAFGIQCYLTGNQTSNATFDACPDDENASASSGITTTLHHYAIYGSPRLTWVNLQSPAADTIGIGGSVSVAANAYGLGVTDTGAQGSGVQAWIGYSASNTNPATWSTWLPASFSGKSGMNDQYAASIGNAIAGEGVYYYASRFQHNGGQYLYGGYSVSGGGIWDSSHYRSGRLVVFGPPPAPGLIAPPNGSAAEGPITDCSWDAVPNALTYRIQLARDSSFTQILLDDSTLIAPARHLTGLSVDSTYYWRARCTSPYGTGAFTTAWSFTVTKVLKTYSIPAGWNMISIPMAVSDPRKTLLHPRAISNAFAYSSAGTYAVSDTLLTGAGYWLKYGGADSAEIIGNLLHRDTVVVNAGWNMIGSISDTVETDSILQDPAGIVVSSYFGYDNGYVKATGIVPGAAYWVKTSAAGTLVLARHSSAAIARSAAREAAGVQPVLFRDAAGEERFLGLLESGRGGPVELPPRPPAGIFDVRFEGNTNAIPAEAPVGVTSRILIADAVYPVTVSWRGHGSGIRAFWSLNGHRIAMAAGGTLTLSSPEDRLSILVHPGPDIPAAYALHQNFPNPFNPSTTIGYDLPSDSRVTLAVYSLLGERVATLVDGVMAAGAHEAVWSPATAASGLYFCRFDASDLSGGTVVFRSVTKLLLLR